MENFFIENGNIILRLLIAVVLGMLIGAERVLVHKEAGMKTHALVSLGAALFIIISLYLSKLSPGVDATRMAANIIVGIGFLGAGSIVLQGSRLRGLTTAGGLWVTAGIGMASGFGLFNLAIISTILVLVIFIGMSFFEKPLLKIAHNFLKDSEKIEKEDAVK
jgi:putative Mg2+ transporter-C (MgtC) family protein